MCVSAGWVGLKSEEDSPFFPLICVSVSIKKTKRKATSGMNLLMRDDLELGSADATHRRSSVVKQSITHII